MPKTDAISEAFLRAYKLDQAHNDGTPDDPETQFAWAAMQGAKERVMECGIDTPRHAALAAISAFGELELIRGGLFTRNVDKLGDVIVADDDLWAYVRRVQNALTGVAGYLFSNGAEDLKPMARENGMKVGLG